MSTFFCGCQTSAWHPSSLGRRDLRWNKRAKREGGRTGVRNDDNHLSHMLSGDGDSVVLQQVTIYV